MTSGKTTSPEWYKQLSNTFWVNSVAISGDAGRVVAGTFFHDYSGKDPGPNTEGTFGTYCYNSNGTPLWSDEFAGVDGVFAVAVSGNGGVAAAGGWFSKTQALLRAYDAADGTSLLNYAGITKRVSCVSLSDDGTVLAAAADDVYLFVSKGGAFPATPEKMGLTAIANSFVTSVAVDPGGKWVAACDMEGNVHVATITQGKIDQTYRWTAPQVPMDHNDPKSATAPVPFLSIQIAKKSESFIVGGGDRVYHFTLDGIKNGAAPMQYDTWDAKAPTGPTSKGKPQQNVRWVAISGDGNFLTAVMNRLGADKNNGAGLLVALRVKNHQLTREWDQALDRNPNSTSMNAAGTHVSASDGYPLGTASQLYLFDGKGKPVWIYPTTNMNWPMVVSAHGTKIAAGGDDGNVYYLTERAAKAASV
jgi:WD40 repeat protein